MRVFSCVLSPTIYYALVQQPRRQANGLNILTAHRGKYPMNNATSFRVVSYLKNGHADEVVEFVEVDGAKFVKGEDGKAKTGEDGKPIPYVAKEKIEVKDDKGVKVDITDYTNAELEELAKVNPKVKKMLDDKAASDKKIADQEAAEAKRKEDDLKARGEWQKLAEDAQSKATGLEEKLKEKEEMLVKYKGTVEGVVDSIIKTIPEDKRNLVPAKFSPREKLEYIVQNAASLGATVSFTQGGKPDKSDTDTGNLTEDQKLVKEIADIEAKATKTPEDWTKHLELSKKLKDLRGAGKK